MIRLWWLRCPAVLVLLPLLALRPVLDAYPDAAQSLYRNGLFELYRTVWDALFGWADHTALILFFLVGMAFWIRAGIRKRTRLRLSTWWVLPNTLGALGVWFLTTWGFNYNCPTLADQNGWSDQSLKAVHLEQLVGKSLSQLEYLHTQALPNGLDTTVSTTPWLPALRASQRQYLAQAGFSGTGKVNVISVRPEGMLHRLSIGGIYLPFSGQGHVDAASHPVSRLFTAAHEMSHGYGVTDEGEANTTAFFTLVHASESELQYAGWMQLLRHALGALKRQDPASAAALRDAFPCWLEQELITIRRWQRKHRPAFPQFSEAINDFYLKQQGMQAGVASYSRFLSHIHQSWQQKP